MNSSWDNSEDNVIWHKSNNNSSYNNANNQTSYNNANNQTMYKKPNYQMSYNNSNNKKSLNKPNNKMVIAILLGVFVVVSGICAFCSNATKKNEIENSIEDSTKTVNNYSDTDDTWTVDDQIVDNISNSDMASTENNVDVTNSEEAIQENITEEPILTGAANTTETQQPVVTTPIPTEQPVVTMPTEISRPIETTNPVPAPTPVPTVVPVVTPQPTATPRPVAYAYLVNQYTSKDSNNQIVYVLANSNNRYFTSSELQSLTKEQLRFARNEIFARKGGKFTTTDLQLYFNSRSWYTPTRNASDFEDKDLNAYELANVKLIQSVESSK